MQDIAVATMTLVRDAHEDRLVRDALGVLHQLGRPVAISDGGSPPPFRAFLDNLPHVRTVAPDGHGLVAQVTASLRAAAQVGVPFVLYTESDKHLFFRDHLARFIECAADDPSVGIVLAARSDASFATFPSSQRDAESTINRLTANSTGAPGDYSYGPFVMRRELVPFLSRVPAEIGWGWRHYIFAIASRRGCRVSHVVGDYPCPADQRADNGGERVHRLRQLAQNVQGLVLAETEPPGDPA